MSKYVIDESTLVALADAIRRKSTVRGQLTTAQMIEIIDSLSTGAVSELQSELVDILPNFHFDLMSDNQFRYTIKAIVTEMKSQESDMKIDLAQCRVELEGDDIALNDDGEPMIMFVGQSLINPVGSTSINQNGTYNVTEFAEVVVDVRSGEISETKISVPFKGVVDGAKINLEFTVNNGNPVIKEMEE